MFAKFHTKCLLGLAQYTQLLEAYNSGEADTDARESDGSKYLVLRTARWLLLNALYGLPHRKEPFAQKP